MSASERTPLPPGLGDLQREPDCLAVREWLAAERERAVDAARARPGDGLAVAAELSAALDGLLAALAARVPAAGGGLALVALDEWARAAPAPGSPLAGALLVAAPAPPEAADAAGELAGLLADAGLDCSLAVRTPEDFRALAARSPEDAAGLLDARLVWGDAGLFAALSRDLEAAFAGRARSCVQAAVAAALARHAREGGSVCRAQPDLVANPGGLADFFLVGWLDRARRLAGRPEGSPGSGLLAAEDFEEARRGASLVAGCRAVAHGLAGARADRLSHELQGKLAAALGYRPGEEAGAAALLMRDVFRAMRAAHGVLKAAVAQQEESGAWGAERRAVVHRRRPVGGDFTRIGNRLYLARPDLFEGRGAGLRMMQGFHAAARARLALSQEFLRRVRDNLYAADGGLRESAGAAGLFREILGTRAGAAEVLRAMHESGFLGAYLPEFAEIEFLVTTDVYHDYTVDEHSLMVVGALDAAEHGAGGSPELAARVAARLPGMEVVKLAGLLHDLGQSRGPAGHQERAAVMLPRIAQQLGLAEDQARLLIFLVENHRVLAEAAGGRLTSEEKLLGELAELVGEHGRLDALYLVTVADLSAVSAGAFPAWRAEQLAALYRRLSARLSARPAPGRGRLAEELARILPAGVGPADAAEHLARVPERYLLEVSPEEAALHLRLLKAMAAERAGGAAEPAAVDFHRRAAHVHFWVLGPDRARRFSQICGAFLASGASIFSARAYTRSDGIIIDQFEVVPAGAAAEAGGAGDEFWLLAAETVRAVLTGRSDLAALVARARERLAAAGAEARRDVPVRVSFDNLVSPDYTVVDVTCADRVGLLYDLGGALSDAGADIAFAKIATQGGVATDVFYVTAGGAKATGREELSRIRAALQKACREPPRAP